MSKISNENLMQKAEDALQHRETVKILPDGKSEIKDSYNGQIAAFGVTIAMSGLRPALAIYRKKTDECDKPQILNAIALMMDIPDKDKPGEVLFHKVLTCSEDELKEYKRRIIACTIALKQVVRTYKLVE
jgi:CRISPR/Cas system CMR-associated protein Cmr5 small subunit